MENTNITPATEEVVEQNVSTPEVAPTEENTNEITKAENKTAMDWNNLKQKHKEENSENAAAIAKLKEENDALKEQVKSSNQTNTPDITGLDEMIAKELNKAIQPLKTQIESINQEKTKQQFDKKVSGLEKLGYSAKDVQDILDSNPKLNGLDDAIQFILINDVDKLQENIINRVNSGQNTASGSAVKGGSSKVAAKKAKDDAEDKEVAAIYKNIAASKGW